MTPAPAGRGPDGRCQSRAGPQDSFPPWPVSGQPSEPKRSSVDPGVMAGVGYSSLFSFRFPQRISLRSVNLRSTLRFRARSTPMRACITKSRPSAAPIRQPVAVCHSSRSCSGFGNIMMKSAASRRVSSSHPSSGIGSSKGRDQAAAGFNWAISYPPSGMCRNAQLPFFSAASTAALSGQIVPLS